MYVIRSYERCTRVPREFTRDRAKKLVGAYSVRLPTVRDRNCYSGYRACGSVTNRPIGRVGLGGPAHPPDE